MEKWKLEAGVTNFTNNSYFTRRATGYPGPGIIPSDARSFYTTLEFVFLKDVIIKQS
jgi:Fe(3+) dicitrate transport protein